MKKSLPFGKKLALLAVCLFLNLVVHSLSAQTVLTVTGEVIKPLTWQATDLKSLPHTELTAKERDGKEHRYSGVPLVNILKEAGVTVGGALRGENLAKYVLVKAADGYEVLFVLPELDPEFATRTIILADTVDGLRE